LAKADKEVGAQRVMSGNKK